MFIARCKRRVLCPVGVSGRFYVRKWKGWKLECKMSCAGGVLSVTVFFFYPVVCLLYVYVFSLTHAHTHPELYVVPHMWPFDSKSYQGCLKPQIYRIIYNICFQTFILIIYLNLKFICIKTCLDISKNGITQL